MTISRAEVIASVERRRRRSQDEKEHLDLLALTLRLLKLIVSRGVV
jgi:hypothetical protein